MGIHPLVFAVNHIGAEIRQGVKEGDQVVTAGKTALREGSDVQVIEAAGAQAQKVAAADKPTAKQ